MAFNINAYSRISGSANNDIITAQDGTALGAPCVYSYVSFQDTIATISAPDYFNPLASVLNVGDLIYIVASDATNFFTVVSLQVQPPHVTVATGVVTGDVSGPASSVNLQPAVFSGTTGKIITGQTWTVQASTPVTVVPYGLYIANTVARTVFNMPATFPEGATLRIAGFGSGGWQLQMALGQIAQIGSHASTSGGTLTSTSRYDVLEIVCAVDNINFQVISSMGNITFA